MYRLGHAGVAGDNGAGILMGYKRVAGGPGAFPGQMSRASPYGRFHTDCGLGVFIDSAARTRHLPAWLPNASPQCSGAS
jgi:hypothetical protein